MITEQCHICKNFIKDSENLICRAFKKGIPSEILSGEFDHTRPFKGDGGIRFDKIPDSELFL